MKKIAFVGTSCVGKTTLLEACRSFFRDKPNVAIVEEVARKFFLEHPNIHERFSKDVQQQIQDLVLQQEQEAEHKGFHTLFCDRSVLDAVFYVHGSGDEEGAMSLLQNIQWWLPTYTQFFLLDPVDVPYETDGVRKEQEDARDRFHASALRVISDAGVQYSLLSGDVGQRLSTVVQFLQQ